MKLFISYARKDGDEFAKNLYQRLEKELPGAGLWWDRAQMEGGRGWWKQIQEAIDQVDFLVLVMTPGVTASVFLLPHQALPGYCRSSCRGHTCRTL